jgi:hypothetical protein
MEPAFLRIKPTFGTKMAVFYTNVKGILFFIPRYSPEPLSYPDSLTAAWLP